MIWRDRGQGGDDRCDACMTQPTERAGFGWMQWRNESGEGTNGVC